MVAQPLAYHIRELRQRLLVSVLIAAAAAGVGYYLRSPLVRFVAAPLHQTLIYTAPSGGFQFLASICLAAGVIVALPVFLYNLLRFVEPAFNRRPISRKRAAGILLASTALSWTGLAFAYYTVLPMSFRFFGTFNTAPIKPLISTNEYLSFVLGCLVTFAAIFQLPLFLLLANSINRFPPGSLRRYRRYVVIGSLGVALVLPFTYDPITQFVVALPIIGLFELSLLAVWLVNRRHQAYLPIDQEVLADSLPQTAQAAALTPEIRLDRRRPVQLG